MRNFGKTVIVLGILLLLLFMALGPMPGGMRNVRENSSMQSAHALGLAMYSYANDNDGNYPDGKSSTEAFQKLLDGGYVSDPGIFYLRMPGKTKAMTGDKLKPENVCWDITGGVDRATSDAIPLLYATGYQVTYMPDGGAVFAPPKENLSGWTRFFFPHGHDSALWHYAEQPGIAVFYKNNSAKFVRESTDTPDWIPHFVPPDFNPHGTYYWQLTPEGSPAPAARL